MNATSYMVVTPARNEENNIPNTIRSMVAQTFRPARWVIVNDGSTDGTASLIEEASRLRDWIVPVHRQDRGFRKQGGGIMEAFYDGYARIASEPWRYLVKFDADLSFDATYFERCLSRFDRDPTLGIGGGMISHEVDGRLVSESPADPTFHVRGATKIYRRACWDAIGGLIKAPGWDTIDEIKANMMGWKTYTFRDIPLRHHRFTGTADGSWKTFVKFGVSNYITGYHPLFMMAKCAARAFRSPYCVGAAGLAWGFMRGYLRGVPRVDDPELIRFVRRQQINYLLGRESLWRNRGGAVSTLPQQAS